MKRKHIAVLLAQPDSTYQKNLLSGILNEAFENNMDVSVFSTFIKDETIAEFRTGELNIFNLPVFEKFDGIILVPDTIKEKAIIEDLISRADKSGVPLVTVDYEIEGYPCIWNNDAHEVELMVDHLIDVHGCKVIDFFSGIKNHPHAVMREEGYRKSLEKHGIKFEPERIHYGDFWRYMGEKVADEILNSGRALPQGIACVCDHSANALAQALINRGYKIPEDFKIVGYDATSVETNIVSDITTMVRNSAYGGALAVRHIASAVGVENIKIGYKYKCNDIITANSCGCGIPLRERVPYQIKPDSNSIYDKEYFDFTSGYNFMMEDLVRVDNYEDFFWSIDYYKRYIKNFDCLHICLCENWNYNDKSEIGAYLTTGYSDLMLEAYVYENGKGKVDMEKVFDKGEMLPELFENAYEKPSVYYFSPMHYYDRCFGYTVLRYINKPVVFNSEYVSWMRNIGNGFEALRRQMKLKQLNDRLEHMYHKMEEYSVTDLLTGIYNRNGYNRYAAEMFNTASENNGNIFVLLGDMNNLKQINDNYGHVEGDESISVCAKAMNASCLENEKCFRIGGDEFVIIGVGDYTPETINSHIERVNRYIENYNATKNKPYSISVSLGHCYTEARAYASIEQIINVADGEMFENKRIMKKKLNITR